MVAAVESMAWTGQVPWHGEGVEVNGNLTPYEMMVAAGLDWTVSKRPTWTSSKPIEDYEKDKHGNIELELLEDPSRFTIVRDTDNAILSSCGAGYKPIQNERIFDFFTKFAKEANVSMETAGSLRGGKDVWALAKLNESFELPGGDEINGYFLFRQPHEAGHAMVIRDTEIRVVCNNTLQFALGKASRGEFRMTHTTEFTDDIAKKAAEALGLIKESNFEFQQAAQLLASKKAKHGSVLEFITRLNQPDLYEEQLEHIRLLEEGKKVGDMFPLRDQFTKYSELTLRALEESPGATLKSSKGTWWGALNAVTFVEDHQRTGSNRAYNAMFGESSKRKAKALNLAIQYAEAA